MKFNELTVKKQQKAKRVGRGISAGGGKTAGRGTKGQGSRKSGGVRPGFEGGQMPIYMRIPKLRGFNSKRPIVEEVYTGQLNLIKATIADNQAFFDAGLIFSPYSNVKLIVRGEPVTTKKNVKLQGASQSAVEMLKKTGGSFERVPRIGRPKSDRTKADK